MSPQMEDTTILYDEIIYDTINNNINNLINNFNTNMFVDNTIQDPIQDHTIIQDPYLLYNTNYINPYFNPLIIPTYINEAYINAPDINAPDINAPDINPIEIIPNIDYTTINYIYDIRLTNIQYNNIIEFLNAFN